MNDYPTTRAEAVAAVAAIAEADADLAAARRGLRAVEAETERMADEIMLGDKITGTNDKIRAVQLRQLLAADPDYLRLATARGRFEALIAVRISDQERATSMLRILLRDMDYVTLRGREERQTPGEKASSTSGGTWMKKAFATGGNPYEDGEGR